MCTLSLIRAIDADGEAEPVPSWRVMFNRDEQRSRPAARPPVERTHGRTHAVYPIDVPSEGTWIAATSAGHVFALLNEYGTASPPRGPEIESRGVIIPALLDAPTIDDAVRRAQGLDAGRWLPFRLVVADAAVVHELVGDGRTIVYEGPSRVDRWMRTSSSVRPAVVRASRATAFDRYVTRRSVGAQNQFHGHECPDRPEEGVRMTRADACTVSTTSVDMFGDRVQVTYRALTALSAAAGAEARTVTMLTAVE